MFNVANSMSRVKTKREFEIEDNYYHALIEQKKGWFF